MNANDLLDLFYARYDAYQFLWSLYLTMIFGLLAFVGVADKAMRSLFVRSILTIGFVSFVFVNLSALYKVSTQRLEIAGAIRDLSEAGSSARITAIVEAGLPDEAWKLIAFHLAADALILLIVWALPWARGKWEAPG